MRIVERGSGRPLLLVPGVQGRWEWMQRTVDALAESHRVITFSLPDSRRTSQVDRARLTLDHLVDRVRSVLDGLTLEQAAVCGVSFGGVLALHFAAQHPERTAALILASTPGPGWRLRRLHEVYTRWPRLFAPLFFAGSPGRLREEIVRAIPDRAERIRFKREQLATLLRAPVSPSWMAARAKLIASADVVEDCRRISAPTLVMCGEPDLDHVVSVGGTLQYLQLIPGAQLKMLENTGHVGCLTRPLVFAQTIVEFLDGALPHRNYAA